jgi:hypothetical protein
MVLGIDADADRRAKQPVVRQRLWPQGIDFEARRLHGRALLRHGALVEQVLAQAEGDEEGSKC